MSGRTTGTSSAAVDSCDTQCVPPPLVPTAATTKEGSTSPTIPVTRTNTAVGAPPNTNWFYDYRETSNPYCAFSNFATQYPFTLQGINWKTAEHYFQAQKFFHDPKHVEAVAALETPEEVFGAGRDLSLRRPDWQAVKDGIMLECVTAKFEQHPELAEILETTGDAYIVERTQNDRYWGDGGDGTGKNMLGHTLMQVRQLLRDKKSTSNVTAAPPPSAKKAE